MTKAAVNHKNVNGKGIHIPDGFDYVSGNRYSGKDLTIRDRQTGSIYVWINSALAIKKINRLMVTIDGKIQEVSSDTSAKAEIAKKRYNALRKVAETTKTDLVLLPGIFHKEGSVATFRM